jgi:hypothetical protein
MTEKKELKKKYKIYASIWHNSGLAKWKLDNCVIIEDNEYNGSCCGGTFTYGRGNIGVKRLAIELIDFLNSMERECDECEDYKDDTMCAKCKFDRMTKDNTVVKFVSDKEVEKIIKKNGGV